MPRKCGGRGMGEEGAEIFDENAWDVTKHLSLVVASSTKSQRDSER